ncbi:MAG: glycosyltransferase family 4 protein, partial [Candidatus Gracilibacteria bacterium]|nr:glycosyltransferase family 4 protein [Candidatus Gracilibacteria bacterium]
IAMGEGGSLDTIIENKTGIFFKKQSANEIIKAVNKFIENKHKFKPEFIREHTAQFDESQFEKKLLNLIEKEWDKWQKTMR